MIDNSINQNDLNILLNELADGQKTEQKLFKAEILESRILLIHVSGRILGQYDSLDVIHRISVAAAGENMQMIVDLTSCTYLSSIVLGALARIAENSIQSGRKICAFGANESIIELLNLTMFMEFVELCDTCEDAIVYLNDNRK
jgi:anti-anti-sigma regulatory factor